MKQNKYKQKKLRLSTFYKSASQWKNKQTKKTSHIESYAGRRWTNIQQA